MEQLDPLGNKFHNRKTRGQSFDKFKKGVNLSRPQPPKGYQVYGPNPVQWEREREQGYKPPADDYRYKGPKKIGGAQTTTRNLQQQIEALVEVAAGDAGEQQTAGGQRSTGPRDRCESAAAAADESDRVLINASLG